MDYFTDHKKKKIDGRESISKRYTHSFTHNKTLYHKNNLEIMKKPLLWKIVFSLNPVLLTAVRYALFFYIFKNTLQCIIYFYQFFLSFSVSVSLCVFINGFCYFYYLPFYLAFPFPAEPLPLFGLFFLYHIEFN